MTLRLGRSEYSELLRKGGKRVKVETITPRAVTGSFGLVTDARNDSDRVEIDLPQPPGVNALYANVPGKGRVKTARYTQWIDEASWLLLPQKPGRISGKFVADITVKRPDNRRRDLDGLIKAPLDFCVLHRIISDDHLAEDLHIRWDGNGSGMKIVLTKYDEAVS